MASFRDNLTSIKHAVREHAPAHTTQPQQPPASTPASDITATVSPDNALNLALSTYPWLRQLGIPISQLRDWVVQGLEGEALYNAAAQTPQYQAMFPGIRRQDGTLRMSESQYLATQEDYRKLLKQYGRPDYEYDNPADFAAFFEQEIDPNELKQRFDTYDTVARGSQEVKDAFYVYAGMKPSNDDLYYAMVSPEARKALIDEYNQRVTAAPLDYKTWITRATEAGLSRVVDKLQQLRDSGVITGGALSQIQSVSPDFARQMMDVLYHGGDPQSTQLLNLSELMHTFEYAMIGSAATSNGLALPDRARVEALRQAGVDRAKALQAYSDFSSQQNFIQGMVHRAGLGQFGQDEFERAVLLQQGDVNARLQNAQEQEKALSFDRGGPTVSYERDTGRVQQSGLRASFS